MKLCIPSLTISTASKFNSGLDVKANFNKAEMLFFNAETIAFGFFSDTKENMAVPEADVVIDLFGC